MDSNKGTAPIPALPPIIKSLKARLPKIPGLLKKDHESIVIMLDGLFAKNKIPI